MNRLLLTILTALVLTAACADLTSEPTAEGTSGTIQYCPDAQDAIAVAQGLPVPYPANPANPTPYDPALPPPIYFHPCLNGVGAPTYRNGVPCVVCSLDNYHAILSPGSFACTDAEPDGTVVVCAAPVADGQLDSCNAALNGCQ